MLTYYLKKVGNEVPGVVAVLCESIAGPHQLIAAKKLNLLNQIKERIKKERINIALVTKYQKLTATIIILPYYRKLTLHEIKVLEINAT